MVSYWLYLGILLIILEAVLPGLVSIFIGLGALTVSSAMHFGYISKPFEQIITFFISSTVYIFTLRLLFMRYYPMDTDKKVIDEDELSIGSEAIVCEEIRPGSDGRIDYNGTTWNARVSLGDPITVGEKVVIIGRSNITWLVEKVK